MDLNNLPASQIFHQINWKTTHCLINRTECLPYFIVKFQVAQYCLLWHRSNASVFRPHLACFSKNLKKYSSSFGCCAAERGDLRTLGFYLCDLRSVNTYRAGSGLKYQDSVEFRCIFSPNIRKSYICVLGLMCLWVKWPISWLKSNLMFVGLKIQPNIQKWGWEELI